MEGDSLDIAIVTGHHQEALAKRGSVVLRRIATFLEIS
jgi:hypothetical protein